MADQDLLFHNGHRARLKEKFQSDKLTDSEKLELLLTYAIPRRDVRPLARALAKHFGGEYYVFAAPLDALISFPGVGANTAILIKLAHSLNMLSYTKKLQTEAVYRQNQTLIDFLRAEMSGLDHEELRVYYLNQDGMIFHHETHSRGTIDATNFFPREIAKTALNLNAGHIILVHNHPLSDNTFSSADINSTKELAAIIKPLGISLYDHFVVTGNGAVHSIKDSIAFR